MTNTATESTLPALPSDSDQMVPMTCPEIVSELDRFIIGQGEAKRSVAIALRNRWRRQQVREDLRNEITPKNILMIGPTGVGKTEIARRLSKLANAPFIKVEATKFTEVGYVGRDVESIIRDLADAAVKLAREGAIKKVKARAEDIAEERILNALLAPATTTSGHKPTEVTATEGEVKDTTTKDAGHTAREESSARQLFRKKLREGKLDDKLIEVDVSGPSVSVEFMTPPRHGRNGQPTSGLIPKHG